MPRYSYVAQNSKGDRVAGAIGAANRRDALSALLGRELTPVQLRKQRDVASPVKASEVESFFEMLSDLLASGMSLSKSMDVLCRRTSSDSMRRVVESIRDQVNDGMALADAMGQHPEVFRPMMTSLVQAGEQSGFLEQSLMQLSEFARREQELRGRVLAALAYPLFLVVVGVIVLLGMMIFFVPRFEPLFDRMASSGELPVATSALLATSDFVRGNSLLIAAALGLLVFAWVATDRESRREAFENIRLRLPWIGPVFGNLAIARFARIMGTMLQGGVPIVRALEIARHSMGNRRLSDAVLASSKNVQSGGSLTDPLRSCELFPIELTEMISVGEQSNRLEKVLLSMAGKLEAKSHRRLDAIVKLIEPCMMVVMAIVVGFLIVALLLPVFNSAGRFY